LVLKQNNILRYVKKIQSIRIKNNFNCIVVSYCVGTCHCDGTLALETLSTKQHNSLIQKNSLLFIIDTEIRNRCNISLVLTGH